jgi:2-oxo-4-hydroxy-4-carboxy-5-ureidoimidazoline decarboxylase
VSEHLKQLCGSAAWTAAMKRAMKAAADACFDQLTDADWLEAFRHHPQIGDLNSLRQKYAGKEQGSVAAASEATLQALAEGNKKYLARHGFIFIVCATGKSADEMLALLNARIDNPTPVELRNAAAEQRKITALRLEAF